MQYTNVDFLIVSPLKRIMKDQIEEMEDFGIPSIVLSTKEHVPLLLFRLLPSLFPV